MPYRAGGQNDLSCEWHYIQLQKYYKQCRTIVDCFYCKTTFIAIIFFRPPFHTFVAHANLHVKESLPNKTTVRRDSTQAYIKTCACRHSQSPPEIE